MSDFVNLSFVYLKRDLNFRNFQSFENTAPTEPTQAPYANVEPSQFGGSFLDPSQPASSSFYGQGADFDQQKSYTGNEFDDEPPLLEGKLN